MPTFLESPTPELAQVAARAHKRARHRLIAWGAFLLLGLAFGVIYATGFATSGGADGSTATAISNSNEPAGNQDTSPLASLVTQPTPNLAYNWAGRWGTVASAALYKVNLDTFANTDLFFSEILLTNTPSDFSDLQLQFRIADVGAGGTCDAAAIVGVADTDDFRVMIFDTDDAQVTFAGLNGVSTGLVGGSTYCIGIADYSGSGKDTAGTFIRKAGGGSFTGTYPTFVATLNQM